MQEMDVKTVLVTGANGFIGSRICRLLAASGYTVRILCRETSDLTLLRDIPYSRVIADITDQETLTPAVTGIDYLIHLAGLIKARDEATFFRINQHGTLCLLNAVKNHNLDLKKFVLVSSVAAAGPASDVPRKEEDPPTPITTYGRSKLAGEEAVEPFRDLFPITIVRPPAVYGPGDRAILTIFDIVNRRIRPYMGGGHNRVQMVHVDDLSRGIVAAMESEQSAGETYFIAEGQSHSTREMMDIIGRLLGKKGIGIVIPGWMLMCIAFVSEIVFRIAGKTPLFSREKARELIADWKLDVSKARRQLDFEAAIDFPSGARATIEWYRREGWLK
jgi:dihydroflavonol-4-reductase